MIFLILIFSLPTVTSDQMKLGACPEVQVVENFDMTKMLGKWFVIEKTDATSSCVTLDFRVDRRQGLVVEEALKPLGITIPIKGMEKFSQVGTLRVPSPTFPAKMKVAFPFSIIPFTEVDFWIMDTDYTTYAAIWSCRSLFFGHRQLAMILSRKNVLDQKIVKKMRDKFEFHSVNPHSLDIVHQKNCNDEKSGDSADTKPNVSKDEHPEIETNTINSELLTY